MCPYSNQSPVTKDALLCLFALILTKIEGEYDQEIPQLQTTPWHREEELLNHHETPGRQIKQSNQLSLPHQDDFNTRTDKQSNVQQNIEQLQTPTMGVTINK